jgi:hypothetical protein
MGLVFEWLARGRLISERASAEMVEILKQAGRRSIMPRYLPNCVVAAPRATGSWRAFADAGIVYLKNGPLVLSLFAYCDPLEEQSENLIAALARVMTDWGRAVQGQSQRPGTG